MSHLAITRYVCLTARADRLFWALPVLMLLVTLLSRFLAATASVESVEMALAFSGAGLRLVVVTGLVLFISFQIRQAYSNREIDGLLARPVSRISFVLAYALGLVVLAVGLSLLASFMLWLMTPVQLVPLFLWSVSLLGELLIVAMAALFFGLLLSSASMAALMVLIFYVASRLVGSLLGAGVIFSGTTGWIGFLANLPSLLLEFVAVLLPRLDLFGQSHWLIYGLPEGRIFVFIIGQSLCYAILLLLLTMLDFSRKRF